MSAMTNRLTALEERTPPAAKEPFDPNVTVVIANVAPISGNEDNVQLLQYIEELFINGLQLPGIELVEVTRRAGRGTAPGLVLVELFSVDDKKTVLRAKMNLRNTQQYKNIYMRSAEGHTDRLIRLNFQTLLRHFNLTNQFRLTGSGRLIARDPTTDGAARQHGQENGGRTSDG